jgi:phage FluMu protein Com
MVFMGLFDRLMGTEKSAQSKDPVFQKKDIRGDGTVYEIYSVQDLESAKQFLSRQKVTKPIDYIIVETPNGSWGLDINGIYLEQLLPWQMNISSYDTDGKLIPMSWNELGLKHAAMGISDNFTLQVTCGKCNSKWLDGVRYQNDTIVQCPQCKAKNRINTKNISVCVI